MKTLLTIFLLLLMIPGNIHAEECESPDINIHIDLVTTETGKETKDEFPDYREGDSMFLKRLLIENRGACDTPAFGLRITFKKPSGKEEILGASAINIRKINESETREYKRLEYWYYSTLDGGKETITSVTLDEDGLWKMRFETLNSTTWQPIGGINRITLNDKHSTKFYVHSRTGYRALELAKESYNSSRLFSILSLGVMILFGLTTIYVQNKSSKEQLNELKNVTKNIEKSTAKQIKTAKKLNEEERRQTIRALISEIQMNIEHSKDILQNKDKILKGHLIIFSEPITIALKKVLTNYYIRDEKIEKELSRAYTQFKVISKFVERSIMANSTGSVIEDTKDIINTITNEIKRWEKLKKEITEYSKKI
ncbi:MAG: hypothetical protein U9Q92_04480 [archaeon]|nr:hypothetical protein [archaeon]